MLGRLSLLAGCPHDQNYSHGDDDQHDEEAKGRSEEETLKLLRLLALIGCHLVSHFQ